MELQVALDCRRWDTLPDAGGYLDQDYQLISRMGALMNVYNVLTHMRSLRGNQIHSLTDGERRVLRVLKDLGLIFH